MGLHFNWLSKFSEIISNIIGIPWSVGYNTNGQLGDNTTANKSSPISVLGGRSYSKIVAMHGNVLGIENQTGYAWVWGEQCGDGTTSNRSSPTSVLGGRSYKDAAINFNGSNSYCLEGSTGYAWGWGRNDLGQLGDGSISNRSSPTSVQGSKSYSTVGGPSNESVILVI